MTVDNRWTRIEQAIALDVGRLTLEEIAERHGFTFREVYEAMKRLEAINGEVQRDHQQP